MTLRHFFDRYAEYSQDAEPQKLASLYAPTFIAGGPQGSQAFTNDSRFLEWLRQVRAFNQQHGMRSLEVVEIRDKALSPVHMLATVTWAARFEKTGEQPATFDIAYLLERAGGDWKVLAYISERDQAEEMRARGLL